MKNISLLVLIALMIFAYSCKNHSVNEEKLKEELKKELLSEMNEKEEKDTDIAYSRTVTRKELVKKKFNNSMAANVKYEGEIIHGEAWEDANGKNFVIFTQKNVETVINEDEPREQSIFLYAHQFADKGDGYKEIGKIQDWQEKCDLAITGEFKLNSVNITDIDKNGKAEITFVYWLGCSGDLGQLTMKLMMLEDGKKYAIRGTTTVPAGWISDDEMKGTKIVGPEFNNAPKGFSDFANKVWDSNQYYPEK